MNCVPSSTEPIPTVSVIVPTFNRAHYLVECLESLLNQTHPAKEIIVVDDGSSDGTAEVVAQFGASITYRKKTNGGKPSAVNLALTEASGDFIWLFDDDDVALPNAIELRLSTVAANPSTGFVYSGHYYGADGPDGRILRQRLYSPPLPESDDAFLLQLMCGCFISLNSALVRRELWLQLGGLDTTLLAGEDYDFLIRLSALTNPIRCDAPTFVVRQHAGLRGTAKTRYKASERERIFRSYSQLLGQKVRSSFELGDYLVPRTRGELSARQRRAALLNRIQTMANLGCISELLVDLELFIKATNSDSKPSRDELKNISTAVTRGWAYATINEEWRPFSEKCLALCKTQNGRACIRAISSGILRLARSYPSSAQIRAKQAFKSANLAILSMTF